MQLIPIKTKILTPPKDDLFAVLDQSLTDIKEGDVILITSKIVAIHEGRCVHMDHGVKEDLVEREAEYLYQGNGSTKPLTIIHHALISAAGIDESNGLGYYILLPKDPTTSAQMIHTYLCDRFQVHNIGVIITDSHSVPFRYGATSISIGFWGFQPVESHVGRSDLFGRVMKYSSTNIVDSLAAASALVCGECDESQPIVIARGVSNLVCRDADMQEALYVPYELDIYKNLFKDFKKHDQV